MNGICYSEKDSKRILLENIRKGIECKNKFIAVNILAIPVMIYYLNIINWALVEIRNTNTKVRKLQPATEISPTCRYKMSLRQRRK